MPAGMGSNLSAVQSGKTSRINLSLSLHLEVVWWFCRRIVRKPTKMLSRVLPENEKTIKLILA